MSHPAPDAFASEPLLSADEAAELLYMTVRLWEQDGKILCFRLARLVFRTSADMGSVQASGIHTIDTIEIQATAEDFAFERLLAADEAIKLIPIHRNTLLLWARQGKIPSISVGRRVFFRASDLNRWLEAPCYAGHAVLIASTERKAT
jgi:excisionase family DNA binding protein